MPRVLALLLVSASVSFAQSPIAQSPIDVKVVVVTMFERGADTGDQPGELQRWVERESLDRILPVSTGLARLADEQRRCARAVHRRRHSKGRGVGDGAGSRPAIRSAPRVLGGRRHRRHRSRGWLDRIGGLGGMDRRWRSGARDRRARDSARLADRLHPAAQGHAVRAAAARAERGRVLPSRAGARRLGVSPHEGREARRHRRRCANNARAMAVIPPRSCRRACSRATRCPAAPSGTAAR